MTRDTALLKTLNSVAEQIVESYRNDGKLLLAGNGGSAADAQHIAGEMINRFRFDRPALPAVALSTDTSVLTAIGNDAHFNDIFARQMQALGRPGDVFIGISTSGRSLNIIKALRECRRKKVVCVSLTGADGGAMRTLSDYCLQVPSSQTPRVQEGHILLAHILCGIIEDTIFGKLKKPAK